MCTQCLQISDPYTPSSLKAVSPKSLMQTLRRFPQGVAKAFGALCFIELPWLPPGFLPPPKDGSQHQAAQACVQRPQAASASPVSTKRPLTDSPSALSPSNLLPLAQRIRSDIQIWESDVESPGKEILRSPPFPENSPSPISPCAKGLPSPAPLVFTPVPPEKSICRNCEAEMTPAQQSETTDRRAFPASS